MKSTSELPDRVQKYCQSLRFEESRPLEPDEHRRLGALRVELGKRAQQGRWLMPLIATGAIGLMLVSRLYGIIFAVVALVVWLPKYRTAKHFTSVLKQETVKPTVDRFVAIESAEIETFFVDQLPAAAKKDQYVIREIEVLANRFVWSVNGNPVPTSLTVIRNVALPPPEVEINIKRMSAADGPEAISRSLTAIEAEEYLVNLQSIKSQSVLWRWLKLGAMFGVLLLAVGLAASAYDGVLDGVIVFGVLGAFVFLVFALVGWGMDQGVWRLYLRLKRDVSDRNVVLIRHPIQEHHGRLVEVLERSGALWTVDGFPARWRTQV